MGPYSCWLLRIWRAYTDCGLLFLCSGIAYALHILNNQHAYGPMEKTMTLLKPVKNASLLTPYEQFFIQAFHKSEMLVSEQNPGEPNPLLQMAINPYHPPT